MSPRKYSGGYTDSKDRFRPITPRKNKSKAKTGAPIRVKKKKGAKKKASKPKVRTSKGTSYWPSFPEARAYALKHDLPMDRIIEYEKGWAIQKEVSGAYYDVKKGGWNSGMSAEYEEFKRYIAISPNQRELQLTSKEIADHPRLSPGEKTALRQYIRARSGNMPDPPPPTKAVKIEGYMILRELSGELVHLYPRVQGDLPTIYKTEAEAEAQSDRLLRNMDVETTILPASEALRYEIPPRQDHGGVPDPQKRSFKSAGKVLEKGWELSGHIPTDAKSVKANVRELERWGLMTLTIPSLMRPGKFVVYARKHPEDRPPQVVLDQALKNNQNVMMWNNEQWEWGYSQGKWLQQSDVTTGEDVGRLIDEPGEVLITPRRHLSGLGSDPDRGTRGKIIYTAPRMEARADLESAYVNSWRRRFNSNTGLSTEKIKGMTDRELRMAIRGNNDMASMAGR